MKNRIVAVWGSPSSGKTVTALKLAHELEMNKKNVIVILADMVCPSLAMFLPKTDIKGRTLGALLSRPNIKHNEILNYAIPLPGHDRIALIGYKNGDNIFTYSRFTERSVSDLFSQSAQLCDYVIVDCSSVLNEDGFTTFCLQYADKVLRLACADLKSYAYFTSQLPLISRARFKKEEHIKVLSNIKLGQEETAFESVYGDIKYLLPHVSEIEQQFTSAALFNKIRITVLGNPVTDAEKGVAASIRIVNPQKLDKEDFVRNNTATSEILDFLSNCLRYGLSVCVTGATGSGKTTLMAWILSTIPDNMRLFTIENGCREFDLVRLDENGKVLNNVVHTVTRDSEDHRQNIDQEKLLEYALTSNPDVVCVGEMKSAEAFAAQEAARTGHAVITTTHANSCLATYNRMVTLCKTKYDMSDKTLYDLVTEAFPIVVFVKKLEDNSRKVMEITECEILPDGKRDINTLYRYEISENTVTDGKISIRGNFRMVRPISETLKKRLRENGMPISEIEKISSGC